MKNLLGAFRNWLMKKLMPLQSFTIGKSEIIGLRGTIRKKTDQDDAWLYQLFSGVDTFFDVGASVGYTSLLGLTQSNIRAILVDASPDSLSMAAKNLIVNSLSFNASFYLAFVSNKEDDEIDFYSDGGAAGSMYSSHAKSAVKNKSVQKVRTTTVDFLSAFYKIVPDLIKIDIEGAELLALEGSVKVASQQKSTFFIEMHRLDERSMQESGDFVINWCKENDYIAYYPTFHQKLESGATIKDRGKCHLILLPKDASYPKELMNIKIRSGLQ